MSLSVPMLAVSLDGRVELDLVTFPAGWERVQAGPLSATWRLGSVRVRLFDFGAAVVENRSALDPDVRVAIESACGRECLDATAETTLLLVDPSRDSSRPRVGWDRVVVRDGHPRTLDAVAHLLGQSAALDRYAQEADRVLVEALSLARELEARGRLPRSISTLSRRVGRIIASRLELARSFFLLDRPEAAWSDPAIHNLHEALAHNLELKERHQAILHRLDAVEEAVDTAMDLWQGRRALALEGVIAMLILVEIAMALAGIV